MTFTQRNADRGLRWRSTNTTGNSASFGYTFISNSRAFSYNFGGTVSLRAVVYNDSVEKVVFEKSVSARTRSEADRVAREEFRKADIRNVLAREAAAL